MPYRSEIGGFTGDSNMGTFIDQIVETFLTDAKVSGGLGWISQIGDLASPVRTKGADPNFEFIFSRGSVGSEAPPYWMMQTTAKSLFLYTGNGVDRTQEAFDQPGNPVNEPNADPPTDPTSTIYENRCMGVNTAVGPYDGYWVFGGPTGEYCHVVLKVNSREYRHFHIGMLTPLDPALDADTFYMTGHRWGFLSPDDLRFSSNSANGGNDEHKPYDEHILPFKNCNPENTSVGKDGRSVGMMIYSPNYGTEGYDWWLMTGSPEQSAPSGGGGGVSVYGQWQNTTQPASVRSVQPMTKSLGDVNTNLESPTGQLRFGTGFVGGHGDALGAIPFACDPTFTTDGVALMPILVGLHSDFESALRWGVVGVVPDVFRVNMKTLDPEQEIVIGSDTYTVFPMINKDANNTISGEGYSGYEGLAYKKITANAT